MDIDYRNPLLTSVDGYLQQLEKAFSALQLSKNHADFPLEVLSYQLESSLDGIEDSVQVILDAHKQDCSVKGLEFLWLKSLLYRCDSIKRSVKESLSFCSWIEETDGVEIWWILRHGIPSLKQIILCRKNLQSNDLAELLKEKQFDPLAAMRDLSERYKQTCDRTTGEKIAQNHMSDIMRTSTIESYEDLAGTLILIAIDEYCIRCNLAEDAVFLSIIMESLSSSDSPRILFLEIAERWLPYNSQSPSTQSDKYSQRDNFISARTSHPEKRFQSIADALAA